MLVFSLDKGCILLDKISYMYNLHLIASTKWRLRQDVRQDRFHPIKLYYSLPQHNNLINNWKFKVFNGKNISLSHFAIKQNL